jgi:hypothetical protein
LRLGARFRLQVLIDRNQQPRGARVSTSRK